MGYRLTDDYTETVVETVFGSKPRLEKSLNEKESLETICRNVTNYFLDKKTKYITISLNFNLNPDRCKGCDSYGFSIIDISTKQILLSESRFNSLDELKRYFVNFLEEKLPKKEIVHNGHKYRLMEEK